MKLKKTVNSTRRAIRTALQVVIATAPTVVLILAGLPAKYSAPALAVFTVIATKAQNLLEDKGIIGTWLREQPIVTTHPSIILPGEPEPNSTF